MFKCCFCHQPFALRLHLGQHHKRYKGACSRLCIRVAAPKTTVQQAAAAASQPPSNPTPQEEADSLPTEDLLLNFSSENQEAEAAQEEQPTLDSTFELFRLFSSWGNGQGAALQDQQALLDLLRKPEFNLDQVRLPAHS
jgi:hypothetical protein